MKTLIMTKKEARKVISEFFDAPSNRKARLWDKVVPYANTFPEIYREVREKKYGKGVSTK